MNVNNGGLSFDFTASNEQLLKIVAESKTAIQTFSVEATKQGGNIDAAFNAAEAAIKKTFSGIGAICEENERHIAKLHAESEKIRKDLNNNPGISAKEEKAMVMRQKAIAEEIKIRQRAIKQANEESAALEKEEADLIAKYNGLKKNEAAYVSLRTQLKNVREELALMEANGQRGTEAFQRLQAEAGRLANAIGDAQTQARIFSHDNRGLQGMISGLQGVAGAFTAAQGTVALFAGENDNLQRIMLRVQSLMSITMGLQQVANTLNKDSAFRLNTLNSLKKWWNDLTGKATELQRAENVVTAQGATEKTANATAITAEKTAVEAHNKAAAAGTVVNKGFALSFRAIGAAIKAIPIIGVIALGISALLGVFDKTEKKADEAAAKAKELIKELQKFKKELNNLSGLSSSAAAEEIVKLDKLYRTATNENKSRKERIKAIKDLKKEWPEWFSNISSETIEVDKLATAYQTLKDNILLYARAEAIKDRVKKNTAQLIDFELEHGSIDNAQNAAQGIDNTIAGNRSSISKLQELRRQYDAEVAKVNAARSRRDQAYRNKSNAYYQPDSDQYSADRAYDQANAEYQRAQRQFQSWYSGFLAQVDKGWKTGGKKVSEYLASTSTSFVDWIDNSVAQFGNANRELQLEKDKYEATLQSIADLTKENEKLEEMLNGLPSPVSASGSGDGGKPTDEDPFLTMLNKRKALYAQYVRWASSEDETVRQAAATEFESLLAMGTSYIDFLEKLRAGLEGKANKTAADLRNIATINNEIAETTKATVIEDFDRQLQADLSMCQTISQMLDVIARRRDDLKNDNSDIDRAESEILTEAEDDIKQKAKDETQALLEQYAGYLQEKIAFEESYARNRELLTKKAAEASTEAERQVAEAALAALEKKRLEYAQHSGSELYDSMLTEFQTVEQQKTAILKKYADMRVEAEKQGNYEMIGLINAKEQEELSKIAAQRLMASESWSQLFTDVSRLGTGTINRLLNEINGQKINFSAQFNPADLQAINEQLERAREELEKRNPFLALNQSLKELRAAMNANKLLDSDDPFVKSLEEKKKQYQQYTEAVNSDDQALAAGAKDAYADLLKEGTSYIDMLRRKIAELQQKKITIGLDVEGEEQLAVLNAALNKETGVTKSVGESIKASFRSIGGSLDFVKGCFDSVIGGIQKMGIAMDEETEAILGDIGGMLEGASQLASGIATGNPLGIIQGSIGFLASTFDLFNSRDRKAEKSIKKHEQAVTKLGHAYTALQHAVDNALGESVYQNQNAMIKTLRQQQQEINGMIEDEKSKKKSDADKIEDYQERYAEVGRQIEDLIKEITESITQTSAGDLANELADALVEAFNSGESAAKAFGEVANNVLANAVKNALKLQFLEKPLQDAIKQLQEDMGFDEEGNGSFNGLTEAEQARFKAAVQAAGANFAEAMKLYEDLFKELDENGDPTTLSGAIKGASQESIDLLAGQTNAVRQNQVISIQILRDQLQHLSNMDNGIAVIANRLLTIINALSSYDDPLRAEGITD